MEDKNMFFRSCEETGFSREKDQFLITINTDNKKFSFKFNECRDYMTGMDCSDYCYHWEVDQTEGTYITTGEFLANNSTIHFKATSGRHISDDEDYDYQTKIIEGIPSKYDEFSCEFLDGNLIFLHDEKKITLKCEDSYSSAYSKEKKILLN